MSGARAAEEGAMTIGMRVGRGGARGANALAAVAFAVTLSAGGLSSCSKATEVPDREASGGGPAATAAPPQAGPSGAASVSATALRAPSATGAPAGPVTVVDLAALKERLEASRRSGRPVFLNFWATWCAPCVQEMPDIAALAREWGTRGPEVIGVSLDGLTVDAATAETRVREMLGKMDIPYPVVIVTGDQQAVFDAYGIPGGIPYSVLYDGGGKTVQVWKGPVEIDGLKRAAASIRG